jgi:hypothetical protein
VALGVIVNGYRLYLRLGDKVSHRNYGQWGHGTVVEEMTSTIQGGTCLVRILFEDGRQRTFGNDLDAQNCCYYFGIRKFWEPEADLSAATRRARAAVVRLARASPPRRRSLPAKETPG